ncbi:TA system VapC family ribonuclease toxin [Nocardioides sambongensis]|uniref:TA system VapC family ribonuclease toxin n=1 Tax=Nocardioides sambongensis TaxID=2589074 RepID=UPI00112685F4|nr:TA system VapC family ribonuclease toxin [Nocardioides sambongensis]
MSELDLPDVNVLVALLHPDHVHHRAAHTWFGSVARFATTPVTESGLVRMALNPTVMGVAAGAGQALDSLRSLRRHERAVFLPDDSSLAEASIDLVGLTGCRQVTDLHLVNLAAAHSARLVTFDSKIQPILAPDDQGSVLTLG